MTPPERLSWPGDPHTLCAQSKVFWKVLSRILSPVFPFRLRSSRHIKKQQQKTLPTLLRYYLLIVKSRFLSTEYSIDKGSFSPLWPRWKVLFALPLGPLAPWIS